MKVKLLTTMLIHGGKTYTKGDELEVNQHVFDLHSTRFEILKAKGGKVITNDEPKKAKTEKKTTAKKSAGKTKAEK